MSHYSPKGLPELLTILKVMVPWKFSIEHWLIGCVPTFTLTPSKYRYILVVKCALTKWIEMIPLRSKEAREITEALFEHVFCRHGSIETVVSDNGTEFVNNTMKQFHELLLTKRLTTTPYNPQSNGSVEIFNRTLADMLYAYVNSN